MILEWLFLAAPVESAAAQPAQRSAGSVSWKMNNHQRAAWKTHLLMKMYTPPKTNMDPEKGPLSERKSIYKENQFVGSNIQVLIFFVLKNVKRMRC